MSRRALPLLALLLLGGCTARDRGFPSLAMRPVELTAEDEPAATQAAAPLSAEGKARIDALSARIDAADAAFRTAEPAARLRVDAAGAPGSETWIAAQETLSILTTASADLGAAINDLDQLSRDLIVSDAPTAQAELDAAAALTARAVTLQTAQAQAMTAFDAKVPTGDVPR